MKGVGYIPREVIAGFLGIVCSITVAADGPTTQGAAFNLNLESNRLPDLSHRLGAASVSTEGNELVVQTGIISRRWVQSESGLRTTKVENLNTGQAWTTSFSTGADWRNAEILGSGGRAQLKSLEARESDDDRFTSEHLEVEAVFLYPETGVELAYRIWAYPGAEGLRTQIWLRGQPQIDDAAALPRLEKLATSTDAEAMGFRVLDLPSGQDWTINLAWAETAEPPAVTLSSVDGEARETLAVSATGGSGALSARLRLDGTVTVRVSGSGSSALIERIWLRGPDGETTVELSTDGTGAVDGAAGIVETLPVSGSLYRGIGYYNDTQHRHEPDLHLLREEIVDAATADWASVLQVESDAGGLMVVKESHKCVNQTGVDTGAFVMTADAVKVTGWGVGAGDLTADEWRWAWATWTVVYDEPTTDARQLALKRFDRVRYPQDAKLDLYLKANTWGSGIDQPASMIRASETEILAELDSVADLGLDTLQIDDGWQIGRMREEADPMVEWQPRPDWYPNGWGPIVARAEAVGVELGIWHAARAPLAALQANWDQARFKTWKLDFARLNAYDGVQSYLAKGRALVNYSDHAMRVNWDVTENAPRFGFFWARECGNIWLANRKPLRPANVVPRPWLMLREAWELAHHLNVTKFELPMQNFRMVNQEVSDAYLHSDTYSVALGLPGIPVFFQTTRLLEEDQREEIKTLLAVYREHRRALFDAFVFPIGEEPSNRSWSGFQWMNPSDENGYALLFRERLSDESSQRLALRFIKPGTAVRLTDLRSGASSVQHLDAEGQIEVSLAQAGDVKFLKITPL